MWLDASDPDADGNAANNPADSATFTSWRDKSGHGHHASTAAGYLDSEYRRTGGINALPTIRFNRLDDSYGSVMRVANLDIRAVSRPDVTVFAVYRPNLSHRNDLGVPLDLGVWGSDNSEWDRFAIALHPGFGDGVNDGVVGLGATNGGATVVGAGRDNVARIMTVKYDGNVNGTGVNSGPVKGSAVYFDGRVVTKFTDNTDATNAQSSFTVGSDGDNSVFNGDISEVIVYDKALTDDDIKKVSDYLADKYTITLAHNPTVTTKPASAVTNFSARVNGSINAHNVPTVSAGFIYGTSRSKLKRGVGTFVSLGQTSVSSNTDTQVSASLSGLIPGKKYYYRTAAFKTKAVSDAKSRIYFRAHSAKLTSRGKAKLQQLAVGSSFVYVSVNGYVNKWGSSKNNLSLSRARAKAVVTYLKELGLQGTFHVKGKGVPKKHGRDARRAGISLYRLPR
jgi:outer membrane protein OmpA-like peptidoglycan-associated protein